MSEAKNLIEEHEELSQEVESLKELLDEASSKIEEVTQVNEKLSDQVKALTEEKESAESELEASEKSNEELREQVEALTQEEQALEKQVSEKLNEIGVDPVSLDSSAEEFDARKEWAQIIDPIEKTKFYRQHKEQILGGTK